VFNLEKNFQEWSKRIAHKVFKYKNGFFEFPYQFTHPKVLVNSINAFSFMKHDSTSQKVSTNNPFFKGGFYYFEIEEGLWITIFEVFYKRNLAFINKNQIEVSGFYNLSFIKLFENENIESKPHINGDVFMNSDWTFYRSENVVNAYHFKNTHSLIATYTFDDNWLEKNLNLSALSENHPLKSLFGLGLDYNPIIKNPVKEAENKIESLFNLMKGLNKSQSNNFLIKTRCQLMIAEFFEEFSNNLVDLNYCKEDKYLITQLINYLESNLYGKFPGIEELSLNVNASPTKIKILFKKWFGCGIAKWFSNRQMEMASKIIKEENALIQDVANKFGYASSSKFTAAFKNYHGVNPSKIN
jgi:AraC-like DNA-binding protein